MNLERCGNIISHGRWFCVCVCVCVCVRERMGDILQKYTICNTKLPNLKMKNVEVLEG